MAWGLGVGVAVAGWRADLSLPRNNRVVALVVVGRGGCILSESEFRAKVW